MPQRISKSAHEYGGRQLKAGDAFEVEPQHVDLLVALGRIEPQEEQRQSYATRAMSARERRTQRKAN